MLGYESIGRLRYFLIVQHMYVLFPASFTRQDRIGICMLNLI